MPFTIPLQNNGPDVAAGLIVRFPDEFNCGPFKESTPEHYLYLGDDLDQSAQTLVLLWASATVPVGGTSCVTFAWPNKPPCSVDYMFLSRNYVSSLPPSLCPALAAAKSPPVGWSSIDLCARSWARTLKVARSNDQGDPRWIERYDFFRELDIQCHSEYSPKWIYPQEQKYGNCKSNLHEVRDSASLESLRYIFEKQVLERRNQLNGNLCRFQPHPANNRRMAISAFLDLVGYLLMRHFRAPTASAPELNNPLDVRLVDWDEVDTAFFHFANNDLHVGAKSPSDGRPQSGWYPQFAELAWAGVRLGYDPTFWMHALPAFVATIPTFMHRYDPHCFERKRKLSEYSGDRACPDSIDTREEARRRARELRSLSMERIEATWAGYLADMLKDEGKPH